MAIKFLTAEEALRADSELWILPDISNSNWAKKIDWYLNFQICKSTRLSPSTFSDFLTQTLIETGIEKRDFLLTVEAPLMIASHDLLPNKWVVILPWKHSLAEWISQSAKIWTNLKKPSCRLFLPTGQSTVSLHQYWNLNDQLQELMVVLD
jgi:hypothetical protein